MLYLKNATGYSASCFNLIKYLHCICLYFFAVWWQGWDPPWNFCHRHFRQTNRRIRKPDQILQVRVQIQFYGTAKRMPHIFIKASTFKFTNISKSEYRPTMYIYWMYLSTYIVKFYWYFNTTLAKIAYFYCQFNFLFCLFQMGRHQQDRR